MIGLYAWSGIGRFSHQHFVQHATERVHISPAIEMPFTRRLLGAHVSGCTNYYAGLGEAIGGLINQRSGDAEVGDQGMILSRCFPVACRPRKQDVAGLDVTMHDAMTVGAVERIGHFTGQPDCFSDRQLSLSLYSRAERLPLHIWHGEPQDVS
jgi:hypothetical protein